MTPEQLAAKLQVAEYRKMRRGAYSKMAATLLNATQDEAPVGTSQSHLRDDLRPVISNTDRPIRITAMTQQDKLGWVVKGTPPHMIVASAAKALHWVVGGADFFAKSVQNPGTKPNDFLSRAAEKSADPVADIQAQAAQDWLDKIAATG